MEIVKIQKTTNNRESTDEDKIEHICIKLPLSLHQELHPMTVPVSFMTLPILIDELWKTFEHIGGEKFRNYNSPQNKNIFKKIMLILAEAKVCCAQRALPHKMDHQQRDLYFHQELLKLDRLAKKLPYPLALYLDCLGNTVEGEIIVTPVLAEVEGLPDIAGAISGGPRQLLPLQELLRHGVDVDGDLHELVKVLKTLPGFESIIFRNDKKFSLQENATEFWILSNGRIGISDGQTEVFQEIVNCFDGMNFNTETDLLKGQGTMAQTVQTPEWQMDHPCRYFCMTNISEYDQMFGATFGFGYTHGRKIQKSRYDGCPKMAYWRGEVTPREMLKSMLDERLLRVSAANFIMEIEVSQKTSNNTESADIDKKKHSPIKLLPPLHPKLQATTVPVSFIALYRLIDELWTTSGDIIGEGKRSWYNKKIFKLKMLLLAKAKVCSAQHAFPQKKYINLPQIDLYSRKELLELNSLAKKLPYPLAMYLDCLGNIVEGEFSITPVLAMMEGSATNRAGDNSHKPRDTLLRRRNILIQNTIFLDIINCFDALNLTTEADLLKGQGTMAQTVQTPEWQMEGPLRYFCMTDISEYDQKLGATFGFSYTRGKKIQNSRYDGCFDSAYCQGEVVPQKLLNSMLYKNSL